MQTFLFEDAGAANFYPLTLTRPLWDLRIGALTLLEKYQHRHPKETVQGLAGGYLNIHQVAPPLGEDCMYLNAAYMLHEDVYKQLIAHLKPESLIARGEEILAYRTSRFSGLWEHRYLELDDLPSGLKEIQLQEDAETPVVRGFTELWHIVELGKEQIAIDYEQLTAWRSSKLHLDPHTRTYNPEDIFLGQGAKTYAAILNAEEGPIYLGYGAVIEEGAILRGPCAVMNGATVTMGAKIKGGTVIGPHCKVGGEVSNSTFWGFSNKGHDGFLGDSYIGQWCNLGADTNTSNLRNTYAPVKLYSQLAGEYQETGMTFLGLVMADHAKAGINTMFNTGTVVGVGANLFGAGFPDKYVPNFEWGDTGDRYDFKKFCEMTERVMARRNVKLELAEIAMLKHVYDLASFS